MNLPAAYDLGPVGFILLLGAALAALPVAWVWRRQRRADTASRLRLLTIATLMLTFDLVLFGAFTRLTDSGLGCPDWPGCYGSTSPQGAQAPIQAAQQALPDGPVTQGKAWIEMVHRYLATGVGGLITVLLLAQLWGARRRPADAFPGWAAATWIWVCLQGAFGALTVTLKLYPLIVTLHLFGGLMLLVFLAVQVQLQRREPLPASGTLQAAAWALAALSLVQILLGAWVSTNYAVLACQDFPTCQGRWWPEMDFTHGFTLLRELGLGRDGGFLPFSALTAIHYTHRLMAYVVLGCMAAFAIALHTTGQPAQRRWALGVALLAAWQVATGVGNVLLGQPLLAAEAHTGGAAAWVLGLATWLARAHLARTASARQAVPDLVRKMRSTALP
jgi:cytochrome c oxidase assembly protein subunit 15